MNAPLYTTEILRLAASLPEAKQLDREDGRAELRSPTCGSRVNLSVQLDDDRCVDRMSIQVHACAFGQASAVLLQAGAAGRSRGDLSVAVTELGDWLGGSDDIPTWPGLSALAPARRHKGRHGAILLPFRALLAAMEAAG